MRATLMIATFSLYLVGIGLFYSFAYLPFKSNYDFNRCLRDADNNFLQKQNEINSHIASLEKEQTIAQQESDKKLVEFLESNPEPKTDSATEYTGWNRLNAVFSGEHYQWEKNKDSIFATVRTIDSEKRNLEKDLEKVAKQKKESEDICYKKFK